MNKISAAVIEHPSAHKARTRADYMALKERIEKHNEMLQQAYANQPDQVFFQPPKFKD